MSDSETRDSFKSFLLESRRDRRRCTGTLDLKCFPRQGLACSMSKICPSLWLKVEELEGTRWNWPPLDLLSGGVQCKAFEEGLEGYFEEGRLEDEQASISLKRCGWLTRSAVVGRAGYLRCDMLLNERHYEMNLLTGHNVRELPKKEWSSVQPSFSNMYP